MLVLHCDPLPQENRPTETGGSVSYVAPAGTYPKFNPGTPPLVEACLVANFLQNMFVISGIAKPSTSLPLPTSLNCWTIPLGHSRARVPSSVCDDAASVAIRAEKIAESLKDGCSSG